MATFKDLSTESGLKQLDDYLLTRTYISGHQASKDDIVVYLAVKETPSSKLVNASRWFNHISTLLQKSFPGVAVGVKAPQIQIQGVPVVAAHANGKADKEDDDDDLDLFGEETEEEKAAALEREGKLKESKSKKESGKSSVLMDVKPWDDETDMVKLEEAVRSVAMPGLYWGASKLQPVGYGIKKLQIMMTIEDDLVSVDNLIEDYLIAEPRNEHIQSCDIVAFNKICKSRLHPSTFYMGGGKASTLKVAMPFQKYFARPTISIAFCGFSHQGRKVKVHFSHLK